MTTYLNPPRPLAKVLVTVPGDDNVTACLPSVAAIILADTTGQDRSEVPTIIEGFRHGVTTYTDEGFTFTPTFFQEEQ